MVRCIYFPLNTKLNPICKSQNYSAGYLNFAHAFLKNLNISRSKQDKFVKPKALCGEGNRHCSVCLKNAVIFLLQNGKDKFI